VPLPTAEEERACYSCLVGGASSLKGGADVTELACFRRHRCAVLRRYTGAELQHCLDKFLD
jgi:hypothetical protein